MSNVIGNYLGQAMTNQMWRIFAIGLCFVIFGLGSLFMAAITPMVLFTLSNRNRTYWARTAIHYWFKFYVSLMQKLGIFTLEINGANKLHRQGLFILANHPSLIDVVILISLIKNCDCIVKQALWINPFTWAPVYLAGFIQNTNGPELVDKAIHSVRSGNNLILFPEGTRSTPGQAISFKRGAANILLKGNFNVTPIVINCSEPTLTKHKPWYHISKQKPHFKLNVLDDLPLTTLFVNQTHNHHELTIQTRTLTKHLQHYFSERVQQYEFNR